MAYRVGWSRRALQDLESIAEYIAGDSPTYAGIVVKKIVNQTKMLAHFPRSGRKVPEFDSEDVRELIVYSYRIIYRLHEREVVIRCGNPRQAGAAISLGMIHANPRESVAKKFPLYIPS